MPSSQRCKHEAQRLSSGLREAHDVHKCGLIKISSASGLFADWSIRSRACAAASTASARFPTFRYSDVQSGPSVPTSRELSWTS